jgi:hypothetical protein
LISFAYLGRRRAGWRSAASLVAAVTLAGGLIAVPSASAGAAVTGAKWSAEPTPNALVTNGRLAADSCASPASCVAVGSYESSSGTAALAEAWNGTSWRIQAVPVPAGGTHGALDGVSCSAVTACTAVGQYTSSQGVRVTLAERWNGTSWSVQATPNPAAGHFSVLNGVSCGSATSCVAVGYYKFGSTGRALLVEGWNGTAWSIKRAGIPPNAAYSVLDGVSCAGAAACVAVGNYLDSSSDLTVTLAEVWNGSAWRITATPNPATSIVNYLLGVSCTSATSCTAVGDWIAGAGKKSAKRSAPLAATLAEAWNGTSWVIQATRNPAGSIGIDSLDSVSCRSPASCSAVGSYSGATGGHKTLNEVWNGTSWVIQATPNPGRNYSSLAGVSCAAAACAAVGVYRDRPGTFLALALASSGTAWAVQAVPSPTGAVLSVLDGVSCASPGACAAVGFLDNSVVNSVPLAESWNGTAWTVQRVPRPAGFGHSSLASVSCGSASSCMAVGKGYNKHSGATLAESWNGTAWAIVPTPAPPGTAGVLTGVSCASATACTAVGWYRDSSNNALPLAESWNGTAWTVQPVPSPANGFSIVLNSVSCTSSSACTAVGSYTASGASVALAERWNGTAWTVQAMPTGDDVLFGVSCGSATVCIAVGNSYTFEHVGPLAEEWRHGTWHVQKTPPISGFLSSLNGVACRSAAACAAVGAYSNPAGVAATLAEAWNGSTWSIQPTPAPRSGTGSVFAGVSPTSATSFTAVGSHLSSADVSVTLAETGPG